MSKETIEFSPYTHRLSVAVETARKAKEVLVKNANNLQATANGLEFKAVVDEIANETIVKNIKKHFPCEAILTEEIGFPEKDAQNLWVIDPLDGTTNFLNGSRMHTILISYIENGKPVVSICCLPRTNEMICAVAGQGVFINDRKIEKPREIRSIKRANITLDPGYDKEGGIKVANAYIKLRPQIGNISMFNGNGYTLALMATGEMAGFIHYSSKVWEIAGIHILEESGGVITDFEGNPLKYDFRQSTAFQFVASRGIDHGELIDLVKTQKI